MTVQTTTARSSRPAGRPWLSILLGFLLPLPAAVCCGATLLGPTIQTFNLSLQKVNGLGPGSFVGAANYAHLPELAGTGAALRFTLIIAIVRLLAVAIVPLLLALAASALGGWMRGGLRLLFTLPLALFAPVGLAAAWSLTGSGGLSSPNGAQGTVLFIDAAQALGLACGLGLIVYLAASRGWSDGAGGWRNVRGPLLLAWIISAVAAFASGLQTFSVPYALTGGGPAQATTTLALLTYRLAYQNLQFGQAAALAVLTLAVLGVLGVLAAVLVAATGARIEPATAARPAAPLMAVGLAVVLVLVLGLAAFGLWAASQLPLVRAALQSLTGAGSLTGRLALGNTLRNALVAPLAVLFVQLPLAYLAALGIGAFRPLGRWSEWLLLPFGPWLFVTVGPLSVAVFMNERQLGQINTITVLLAPLLLSVPMLFVLALFFRSSASRWKAARAAGRPAFGSFLGEVIAPSIPLALLLGVLGVLASNQELLWPLVVTQRPELATPNVALVALLARLTSRGADLAPGIILAVLPGFLFGLVALGVLQLVYVGRLALRTGPLPDETS
jgi:ABC-type sugar transport system permease subunit